jgi:hypothetical protein
MHEPALILSLILLSLGLSLLSVFSSQIAEALLRTSGRRLQGLKQQILKTRTEVAKTSPQDQFAHWAKLKRSLDKDFKEYQELSKAYQSLQSKVSWALFALNWALYLGALVVGWDTPVFWIPRDFLGPVLTDWAAWPLAPLGSVGIFYVLSSGCSVFKRLLQGKL